jgi:predicted nucleic acid-binding protein
MEVLIDSNVILDVFTKDKKWFKWSSKTLCRYADDHILVINPIIYAEISVRFDKIEDLEDALPFEFFSRRQLPWEAAFVAGKCFLRYIKMGGKKRSPLPDFYIGAHAAVAGMALLTRDVSRYRTYFPKLKLISPK